MPYVKIKLEIVIENVFSIGFSKNTIKWDKCYLAKRHFTVEVAN